jgi:RNA polymerase sigma-70 factor (ECF subfamily)
VEGQVQTEQPTAAALYAAHERRVGQFLRQMVADRALADDLLQDVFEIATRRGDVLAAADDPAAWLFGVARNRALAALRRQGRARRAFERLVGLRGRADEDGPEGAVALRDLLARTLAPEDHALLVLRYVHDLDTPALAGITGASEAAVRQRLTRARARLRAVWPKEDDR